MNRKLIITVLILISVKVYGQNVIEEVAKKTCECMQNISDDQNIDEEDLGICILEAAALHKEALKSQHNIDIENLDVEGEKLGRKIGALMLSLCPDQVKRLALLEKNEEEKTTQGKVVRITDDGFVVFSVRDKEGKSSKFYWLSFIKSSENLQENFERLKNKKVKIEYFEQELFDPKIKEYRSFNIILTLEIIR